MVLAVAEIFMWMIVQRDGGVPTGDGMDMAGIMVGGITGADSDQSSTKIE